METPGDAYFVIANYVFDVDFRVLRDSLRRAGGRVFLSGPDSHLVVAAVRFSPADGVAPESPQYSANRVRSHNIRRAFRERLVREGPQKFFQFKRRFEERRPVLDARGLHEWLRAACGDPVALNLAYSDALLEDLTRLTAQSSSNAGANELRMALYETLLSVEALFYPLGGAGEEDGGEKAGVQEGRGQEIGRSESEKEEVGRLRHDAEGTSPPQRGRRPVRLQSTAAMAAISTRRSEIARRASTVARAGMLSLSSHAS